MDHFVNITKMVSKLRCGNKASKDACTSENDAVINEHADALEALGSEIVAQYKDGNASTIDNLVSSVIARAVNMYHYAVSILYSDGKNADTLKSAYNTFIKKIDTFYVKLYEHYNGSSLSKAINNFIKAINSLVKTTKACTKTDSNNKDAHVSCATNDIFYLSQTAKDWILMYIYPSISRALELMKYDYNASLNDHVHVLNDALRQLSDEIEILDCQNVNTLQTRFSAVIMVNCLSKILNTIYNLKYNIMHLMMLAVVYLPDIQYYNSIIKRMNYIFMLCDQMSKVVSESPNGIDCQSKLWLLMYGKLDILVSIMMHIASIASNLYSAGVNNKTVLFDNDKEVLSCCRALLDRVNIDERTNTMSNSLWKSVTLDSVSGNTANFTSDIIKGAHSGPGVYDGDARLNDIIDLIVAIS